MVYEMLCNGIEILCVFCNNMDFGVQQEYDVNGVMLFVVVMILVYVGVVVVFIVGYIKKRRFNNEEEV